MYQITQTRVKTSELKPLFIKLTPWLMLTEYKNKHSDGKYCKQEIFNLVHNIFILSYMTYDFYLQKKFLQHSLIWFK